MNFAIVLWYLRSPTLFYHFPFWISVLALGWFFPQAVGGYLNLTEFPDYAYADGMFFASSCALATWGGYAWAHGREDVGSSWLDWRFDLDRLYWACSALCLFGFYFQWKLWSLPMELIMETQWSGVTVKYLFLSSVFRFGFIGLWMLYLCQPRIWVPKLLVFIVPSFYVLFRTAVLEGRREAMMDLLAYALVGLWLGRGKAVPRWVIACGLAFGLILINAIGTYRALLFYGDKTFSERVSDIVSADYVETSREMMSDSGSEFKNYIYYRYIYQDMGRYDLGLFHWNKLVFNYVPAQIVGRGLKESLMIPLLDANETAQREYGFNYMRGSTSTGYRDAFGSFGWFGFIKFLAIGYIMGVLYRHAERGGLLARIMYVYLLGAAMLAVTHTTHRILFSSWVYFFGLGFPAFIWARLRAHEEQGDSLAEVIYE